MAGLNPHRGFGTSDIGANTAPLYFSDVMTAAIYAENTLLPYVKKGEEVDQVAMRWVEDSINPFVLTVAADASQAGGVAVGVAGTNITVASGTGKLVRRGSILLVSRMSGLVNEQIRVIGMPIGDSFDVERANGNTTAVAIAANDTLTLIGSSLEDNSGLQTDITRARVGKLNYCQVFEASVEVSRRQMKRKMVAVANEFAKSIKDRTIEKKRELENAVIFSRAQATNPDGDYSTMRGTLDLLTDASVPANFIVDNAAAAITEAQLNAQVAVVAANGGKLTTIFAPQRIARAFSSSTFFGGGSATGIRWTSSDRVRGQYVRQYLSDVGWVLDILSSPFLRTDVMALLNTELMSLHAFTESDWFMIQAPTLQDGKATRLLGDYTFKLEHAGETHLLIRNIG